MSANILPTSLEGQKYLSLETYRKNGAGVRTPVWFAASPAEAVFYVYTTADSGKAKRLRHSNDVRIAPCDMRGAITGAWTNGHATIVDGEASKRGMQLLNRKYRPWKQILDLSILLFPRHQRIVIAIRPSAATA